MNVKAMCFSTQCFTLVMAFVAAGCSQMQPMESAPPRTVAVNPVHAPVLPEKPELLVRIGHAAPMTGPQAHLGVDHKRGVELAIAELNAKGVDINGARARFELISKDDKGNAQQAAPVARQLREEKVVAVVGHLNSSVTVPASRYYAEAGIPQVSGASTNPQYTQQGLKTAFRVATNDTRQGQALAEFIIKKGVKKVAIIDDGSVYGQVLSKGFTNALRASRVQIVATEQTNPLVKQFKGLLERLKAKQPELVFFAGMDDQAVDLVKQMRAQGLDAQFLAGDGGCTGDFAKYANGAAQGAWCSLPVTPLWARPQGRKFSDQFVRRFNAEVLLYAPYSYDATMVIAEAIKQAGSLESSKVLSELRRLDYQGVTSRIRFDANGDLIRAPISFYQIRGTQLEYMETLGGDE
ncbi:MAG TPA: branched-chain amino acid ABC transporter substrate-binding protein [Rhodocyclaceae bacterium]|nr:branched-chain amino acid ABC transporter substrate-binding protein [Rhodocyclaceae bacterium]